MSEVVEPTILLVTIESLSDFGYRVYWTSVEGEHKIGLVPLRHVTNKHIRKGTVVRAKIIQQEGNYHDLQFV